MDNFEKYQVLCRLNTVISILSVIAALIFVPYLLPIDSGAALGLFAMFSATFLLTLIGEEWYLDLDPELETLLKNMPDKDLWEVLSGDICKYAYKCPHYTESSKSCNNHSFRFKSIDNSFCGTFRDFEGIEIIRPEVSEDVY
jgi:hypothetical protein